MNYYFNTKYLKLLTTTQVEAELRQLRKLEIELKKHYARLEDMKKIVEIERNITRFKTRIEKINNLK
jgi:hypothetical protein